ncbi:Cof subfamily of IIB subfamily of haloacid dehalogenase superfamily/HAD-superfamily hydrolase, subfamily IIB [Microbacterium testaceum StLB037]|uniref:Cof subfamily of IIB subfamily of haloacid dehalogenase superfamily/HAD-superfamily hydrolase, subfamily IIB n=1 Tax=Microbacterium testaceum (strain StLB037) TaxID=979556 RepID=A0A1H0MYN1_MICTS|nr:HAD family hydrolase [Microbacterium testaceum]SDO85395.1 Cof subfamily of IIB subfamily of haloacid dehalogenase superfamily/HAD-superfamily hydrolase, subfamily IIB [Microbacterium testaceum StLB037]
MSDEAALPDTGAVESAPKQEAADLVADLADAPQLGRLLIALDIDGTVLLEDDTLSPGVVEAIAHAHRAGHEVMLATGRSWDSTHTIMDRLGIRPEYAVCSNGAIVMRRVGGADATEYERAHVETFDPSEVLTLLGEHLSGAHFLVELPDGTRKFTDYLDDWNLEKAHKVTFAELSAEPVCRVVVVAPEQTDQDFLELVERIGLTQVSYAIGWTAWLDIAPQGVDKSTALELVRGWLGIAPERVLVMGDGRNDIEMMQWAVRNGGRAIAMHQGPPEVHVAAGEVGLSVTEGGVAAILRAL